MKTPQQKFHLAVKILATAMLLAQGLYYSIVQTGPMDVYNAVMGGLVVLAIWFMRERTK